MPLLGFLEPSDLEVSFLFIATQRHLTYWQLGSAKTGSDTPPVGGKGRVCVLEYRIGGSGCGESMGRKRNTGDTRTSAGERVGVRTNPFLAAFYAPPSPPQSLLLAQPQASA